MALEEALNRNSELLEKHNAQLEKHNALLERVLGQAGAAAPKDKPAVKDKATAKDKPKDDGGDVDLDTVKPLVLAWLGEFKDNESDPETNKRREVFGAALKKLTGSPPKLGDITEASDFPRVLKWLDGQKAKGRLTGPLPDSDAEDEAAGDGEDI